MRAFGDLLQAHLFFCIADVFWGLMNIHTQPLQKRKVQDTGLEASVCLVCYVLKVSGVLTHLLHIHVLATHVIMRSCIADVFWA